MAAKRQQGHRAQVGGKCRYERSYMIQMIRFRLNGRECIQPLKNGVMYVVYEDKNFGPLVDGSRYIIKVTLQWANHVSRWMCRMCHGF